MSFTSLKWSPAPKWQSCVRSIIRSKQLSMRFAMTAALQAAEPARTTDRIHCGGRAGKRSGAGAAFEQPPFQQLRNTLQPTKLVKDDEFEAIHLASRRVLQEIGLDIMHEERRRIMK